MMNYVNYAVVEATLGLDFVTKFDTLEEANAYAHEVYDEMTDRDKEVYEVYVAGIDEDGHKTEIEDAFNSIVTYGEEHPEARYAESADDNEYVTYATVVLGYRKPIYKTFDTIEEAEADARKEFAHWNDYNKDLLQLFVVGIRKQDIPENDSVFAFNHRFFTGHEIIPNTFNSMDAVRAEIKAQIRENNAEREAEQAKADAESEAEQAKADAEQAKINAEKSAAEMMHPAAQKAFNEQLYPGVTPEAVSDYLLDCWQAFCASDFGGGLMTVVLEMAAKWLQHAAEITVKSLTDYSSYAKKGRKFLIAIGDGVCIRHEYHIGNVRDIDANPILSEIANSYAPADRTINDTLKMWTFKKGRFIRTLMMLDAHGWSDINPLCINDCGEVTIDPKYDSITDALHQCAAEALARIDADPNTTHYSHYEIGSKDVRYYLHTKLYLMFPPDSDSDSEKRLALAKWIDSTTINVITPDQADEMKTVVIQAHDNSIQITHRIKDIKDLPGEVILSYALADYYKAQKK